MATTIRIPIPDILSENYPVLGVMKQSFYEDIILGEYQKGQISLREAAELFDLTYEGFVEWLGTQKLLFINATKEELQEDYYEFEKLMEQQTS